MITSKLEQILQCAVSLFINQGYERTQIKDIVKKTSISTGAIYSLFSSKKAIWCSVLQSSIDKNFINSNLTIPISEDQFADLDAILSSTFENTIDDFKKKTSSEEMNTIDNMLSYSYELLHTFSIGCLIVENNPTVNKELFNRYMVFRKSFFAIILKSVTYYMKHNQIREFSNIQLGTIFIIESLTWWSMDIWYKNLETHKNISKEQAKSVCIDFILNGLK